MYKSILVPLDGSTQAEAALRHAVSHEDTIEKLTLVRVLHSVDQLIGTQQPNPYDSMEKSEEILAREAYDDEHIEARRYLGAVKTALASQPFDISGVIVEGDAAEQILGVAAQVKADLIVLTSMGLSAASTPTRTGVFGRVSDAILKGSTAPVLVVKP